MSLVNTKFILSAPSKEYWPESSLGEVVILGRSNVGKSTFVNLLCNDSTIAKVSSTPGHTKLLNFFNVNNDFMLVDAPGYGYNKTSKGNDAQFASMMEQYLFERDNLKLSILLLDSRIRPTSDDQLIYQMLVKKKLKIFIVATKSDKLNQSLKHQFQKNMEEIFHIKDPKQIFFTSKLDYQSADAIALAIERFFKPITA